MIDEKELEKLPVTSIEANIDSSGVQVLMSPRLRIFLPLVMGATSLPLMI